MATVHNLNQIAYSWRTLDPDNVSAEVVLAALNPLNVSVILGACKLDSRYFAVIWKDSDGDLQLGCYDRTGLDFNYVEVSSAVLGSDARLERVSDTKVALYFQEGSDWYVKTYVITDGTVNGTANASLAASSTTPAQTSHHDMCVLSETLLMVSYVSNGSSPYQVTFETVTIESGTLAKVASSAANVASINGCNSVALARLSATQALVYHAGGASGGGAYGNIITVGTPVTFGTRSEIGNTNSEFYSNVIPAVADDGTFAIFPYQLNSPLASAYSYITGATIAAGAVTGNPPYPTAEAANLPASDAGSPTGGTAATCCYLAKEGDFHVAATMGNYKDPLNNQIWGIIVAFKDQNTMAFGGTFHLPAGVYNAIPCMFRQDQNTITVVYQNANQDPAFINVILNQ